MSSAQRSGRSRCSRSIGLPAMLPDASQTARIRTRTTVTGTWMRTFDDRERLARDVLAFAAELGAG